MKILHKPVVIISLLYLILPLLSLLVKSPYESTESNIRDCYAILFFVIVFILGFLGFIKLVMNKKRGFSCRTYVIFLALLSLVPIYQPGCCAVNASLNFFGSMIVYSSPKFSELEIGGQWRFEFSADMFFVVLLGALVMYLANLYLSERLKTKK